MPFFFSCAPSFDFVLSSLTDLCMQAAVEAPCSAPLTGSGSKVETSVNLLAYSDLEWDQMNSSGQLKRNFWRDTKL